MELKMMCTAKAPLVMQAPRLVNPLDPLTKEYKKLTSKRKKTDEDHLEIYHIEFVASLHFNKEFGPYLPGAMILASLVSGAKRTRRGSLVERSVIVLEDEIPLLYSGPRTVEELWADDEFHLLEPIVLGAGTRTMRMRPIFRAWSCEVRLDIDTSELNFDDFVEVADTAGRREGYGTWRPRFGRYTVDIEPVLEVANARSGKQFAINR